MNLDVSFRLEQLNNIIHRDGGNISNQRESVSPHMQILRSGLKKRGAAELFFHQLRSVGSKGVARGGPGLPVSPPFASLF